MKNVIIIATPAFERKAAELLTSEGLNALYDHLQQMPDAGVIIPGTGG